MSPHLCVCASVWLDEHEGLIQKDLYKSFYFYDPFRPAADRVF